MAPTNLHPTRDRMARRPTGWPWLAALLLALSAAALAAQQADTAAAAPVDMSDDSREGVNDVRIEDEMKIAVPDSLVEPVWAYLQSRYLPRPTFLEENGAVYAARASEEFFADVYYDTPDFWFLRGQHGLRHRSRTIPGDTTNRKNGRELMQIKLHREHDDSTARSEIKFPVAYYPMSRDEEDHVPPAGLVERTKRPAFLQRLAELGVNPAALREILTIEQRRRRVYVSEAGRIFLSLTLDEGRAHRFGVTRRFTEIELELNEIVFTGAGGAQRERLKHLNDLVRADLVARFPALVQDQTPKYNKMMARFQDSPVFRVMLWTHLHPDASGATVTGFTLVGLLGVLLVARRREARGA